MSLIARGAAFKYSVLSYLSFLIHGTSQANAHAQVIGNCSELYGCHVTSTATGPGGGGVMLAGPCDARAPPGG